ncbi:hypothetical protein HPB51_008917 [Rhipicephalus microplus]|uniref:GB1/RHD3-type G domain-containing protein n=1 Tax=Rhipicephalus microplus TaxID=6941 RepID=A0A9J6E8H4_RHIMP|nr:hypothetical protein HPB51_008917 [Rhipicephalus microplus]
MSDHVDSGQPLQMLNVNGRSLELDEHGLARLLLDERIKDHPVVVIAVAGAFRKGKSFLLCFLLRYLRNIGRADWLGDPNAPLEGFKWQAGSQCQTTGILLWNEVFLVENSRGEKLAVVLMDTQGTFDCKSATVVHSSIFALSALISSVLVYNVSQNIQENDLQHLQAFIEYGILAQSDQQQQYRNMPDEDVLATDCEKSLHHYCIAGFRNAPPCLDVGVLFLREDQGRELDEEGADISDGCRDSSQEKEWGLKQERD